MRIEKSGLAAHEFDVMEREIFQDTPALHIHDFAFVVHEIVDSEIFLERIVDAVEAALLEPGKIKRRLPKGFPPDCAPVDPMAAQWVGGLEDTAPLAEKRGLGTAIFAGGATANNDQIEIAARSHKSPVKLCRTVQLPYPGEL